MVIKYQLRFDHLDESQALCITTFDSMPEDLMVGDQWTCRHGQINKITGIQQVDV